MTRVTDVQYDPHKMDSGIYRPPPFERRRAATQVSLAACEKQVVPWGKSASATPAWVGYASMIENLGASNYNSLQVTLTQRAWKGLDCLTGYTWAHAIDNGTSNRSRDAPQDAWNYNAMRGNGELMSLVVSYKSYGMPPCRVTMLVNCQPSSSCVGDDVLQQRIREEGVDDRDARVTHFAARNRLGRTLVFMARILQDARAAEIRDIAVEQRTSVLLEPDARSTVTGAGRACSLRASQAPEVCKPGTPLTFKRIAVQSLPAGQHFGVCTGRPARALPTHCRLKPA